jgi:signal transduction histidine kinase
MNAPAPDPSAFIVIEDSADDYALVVRRLAAAYPKATTTRVDSAAGLEAALAAGGVDAVLCDHRLPGFSLPEALAIVRAKSQDLPFIVVSGAIGEDAVVDVMRAGVDDFVMKDRLSRLEPVLVRALDAAAGRRRQREIETAYQESEARLRAVAANLPGMMFRIDIRDGRVAFGYASDGARRLFGVPPEAIVADAAAFFGRFGVADAAALLAALHHGVDGDGFLTWTGAVTAPDVVEWVQIEAMSRLIGNAHVVWDGLVIDVTATKHAARDLTRSREELRELAAHLEAAREDERDVVARELHDEVGSMLTGVKFETTWLKGLLRNAPEASDSLKQLDELVEGAVLACNRIMQGLRPAIIEQGIVAALEWQVDSFGQRHGIGCRFHPPPREIALDPGAEMAVFRICQESLNNIAKHAMARNVDVTLDVDADALSLAVADDGIGLAESAIHKPGHFGLRGMRERALMLGGHLAIASSVAGTVITLRLPLPQAVLPAAAGAAPATATSR